METIGSFHFTLNDKRVEITDALPCTAETIYRVFHPKRFTE